MHLIYDCIKKQKDNILDVKKKFEDLKNEIIIEYKYTSYANIFEDQLNYILEIFILQMNNIWII